MNNHDIELPHSDEAAAHMLPSDLKKFEFGEHVAEAFSIAVGNPDETSQPLFTLDQVRAAIEPYAKHIAELESQIEAIGAGGVTQGQRLMGDDGRCGGEPVAITPIADMCKILKEHYAEEAERTDCTILYTVTFDQLRAIYDRGRREAPQPAEPVSQHPDDAAVDAFAAAMKAKLAKKRAEGRGNWQMCTSTYLSRLLREHVEKGDPVDVANLAMMLHQNGQGIAPAEPVKVPSGEEIETLRKEVLEAANSKGQVLSDHMLICAALRRYGQPAQPAACKPDLQSVDCKPAPIAQANSTLAAHTDLLTYVLQDDVHNRLTPRVIDIAYTAFMCAKKPSAEDGGASDWFTDTKPVVTEAIEKLRKDLFADRKTVAAQPSVPEPLKYGEKWQDHYVTGWNDCRAAMLAQTQIADRQAQQDDPTPEEEAEWRRIEAAKERP